MRRLFRSDGEMPFELFFNNVGNLTLRLKQTRVRRYFTRFGRVCPNQINSDFAAPKDCTSEPAVCHP
ncbi:hypothetical protein EPM78_05680 [Neisseria gonorrhoeae]|uniref:Uncharacterized protein n=1 Tax=Neisseria gonorrhoeae TaxID=485 RepID=A0AAX2TSH8_NEIGO|nr:hypothetical protein A6J44_10340 [Neisseria gonorrhoeae]ARC03565.1 hypothetical protein A6J46_07330 [Neisseria gonorrhoeae]ASQ71324.1 hypothetical protein BZG33_06220 [Neisseria gonorrhoeae]ASQ73332.1 hypothetical protein BZG34_04305 [Neisseria gonorrhoeae]AZG18021.1 hypothetical protein EGH15_03895 [Neisseria gonorrhoeae]